MDKKVVEYRGISGLVAAPLTTDTEETLSYGDVFDVAGIAELSKTTETSTAAHYYDNAPAVVISGNGADETKCTVSAIPDDVVAKLTGQQYIEALGALAEGNPTFPYLAFGYITKDTDGSERWVWRYKNKCSIPEETHKTEDDGTDAEGQEFTLTGVNTNHKFTETGKSAKALVYDPSKNLITKANFFGSVQTLDTLRALVPTTP